MSLYIELQKCKNETDIERVYKNSLEKILKKEPNFELTRDTSNDGILITDSLCTLLEFKDNQNFKNILSRTNVIIQCLYYLIQLKELGKGIPSSIFIGDRDECFILDTKVLYKYFNREIKGSASTAHLNNPDLIIEMTNDVDIQEYSAYIYTITETFKLNEIIETLKEIHSGNLTKIKVNKNNISIIFETFEKEVLGKNTLTVNERVNLFIQLILNPDDNGLNYNSTKLITKNYGSIPVKDFKSFFKRYEGINYTPSEKEQLTSFSDRMIEDETRRRKGEFYTPTIWVDEAHKEISNHLGEDWKDRYIVWDCCCGSGNLTRDYKFKHLYLSTLEQSDIDTINTMGYNPEAIKFQYDFLNDGMDKLPESLRTVIENGEELLFFINPPYMKATPNKGNITSGDSLTVVGKEMQLHKYGIASSQLSSQFLYKISNLNERYNNIKLCLYNNPNFLTSDGFKILREKIFNNFSYTYGFLFSADHFSETSGLWGILFSIWNNNKNKNKDFKTELKDIGLYDIENIGTKILYNCDDNIKSNYFFKMNEKNDVIQPPIKSVLTIDKSKEKLGYSKAIGYINNHSNNMMQQHVVFLASSVISANGNKSITIDNFNNVCALFTARKSIKCNWINCKDEYIAPNTNHSEWQKFINDSVVYSLFHIHSFQSSLRQVEYKDKLWDIKNEFFWLSNDFMKNLANDNNYDELYQDAKNNNNERFVYNYLQNIELSTDAKIILNMATELLVESIKMRKLMSQQNPEYHLNSWDAGYAQMKLVWKLYYKDKFKEFREAYTQFEKRLIPLVYELGFLKS